MASVKSDAAAAAAAAARRAEEARRRAEEAKAAQARAAAAAAKKAAAAKPKAAVRLGKDELSTGMGRALRQNAAKLLGSTSLAPSVLPRADLAAPIKASAFRADATIPVRQLDAQTGSAPTSEVDQAAAAVHAAGEGITDPVERGAAVAREIEVQSEKFKDDPAAASAFVEAIEDDIEEVGRGLAVPITEDHKGDSDTRTRETLEALTNASENLGTGAAFELGQTLATTLPDDDDLMHFDDELRDLAPDSEQARALLFGVNQGLVEQGKMKAVENLEGTLRTVTTLSGVVPGDFLQPVDPNAPDALAQAQFNLAQALAYQDSFGGDALSNYASALDAQLEAFAGNPQLQAELARSQEHGIEQLVLSTGVDGLGGNPNAWRLDVALKAAQAAGPATLTKFAETYANQLQGVPGDEFRGIANGVSPEAATALAFAFDKVGNTDAASVFANRAADRLDAVASAANDANDEVAELQADLDKELASAGPALTEEQKQQYADAFWEKHQDAIDTQKSANAALQQALTADLDTLTRLAELNPEAGSAVADGLKELARDPAQAEFVSRTVTTLAASGTFPAGFQDAEQGLVEALATSTQTRAGQLLTSGDTAGAAALLEELNTFLEDTEFTSGDVKDFVSETLPTLKEFTGVVQDAVRSGDLTALTAFLTGPRGEALGKAATGDGFGQLISSVTSSVGMAAAIAVAADSPTGAEQLLTIAKAGKYGAQAIAYGFNAVSNAWRDASNTLLREAGESVGAIATKLNKFLPVVNVAIGVVQGLMSLPDAINDPNLRTVGTAVGNAISVVGGAIALVPGGQLVGGIVSAVGFAVGLVSGWIQGIFDNNARKDEQKELLAGVLRDAYPGYSDQRIEDIAARITNTGADLTKLAQDCGLTPQQMVALADRLPVMGEGYFRSINEIARLSGLQGQALVNWLTSIDDLDAKLLEWTTSGFEFNAQQSAGTSAHLYAEGEATRAAARGEDYAEAYQAAYQQKYDEVYEANMRAMLEGRGLAP